MENSIQQEILLMTNSSLSKRSFCEEKSIESERLSNVDRLEQACWNGMLQELLPGLLEKVRGRTLCLWEIQSAKTFLHIDLCDRPVFLNKEFSIDPYIFLNHLYFN